MPTATKRSAKKAAPVAPESESQVAPSAIVPMAFSRLRRAPENVRQTDIAADVESLADDIAAHGLLQSLIGYVWNPRVPTTSAIFIVGGGRRLQALQLLHERGAIGDDFPVPVLVRPKDEAIELSLSENLARRDMNPADEFVAFQELMKPGTLSTADLAKRYGFSERYVKQRLRLGALAPEILDALRASKMTIDAAMAYAQSQDHKLQIRVFKAEEKKGWKPHDPANIGYAYQSAQLTSKDTLFQFVGADAYEARGGGYEDDLFGDADRWGGRKLKDGPLLLQIAQEMVPEAQRKLLAEAIKTHPTTVNVLVPAGVRSGAAPKCPRGCKLIDRGYNYNWPSMEELRDKAAKLGIEITAIASVSGSGEMKMEQRFFVPSESYDEVVPKKGEGAPAKSAEQLAAERRLNTIRSIAAHLAARQVRDDKVEGRQYWITTRPWLSRKEDIAGVGACYPVGINVFVTDAEIDAQLAAAEEVLAKQEALEAAKREMEEKARAERDERREALLALDPAPAVVLIDEAAYFRWESGAWSDLRDGDGTDEDGQFYDDLDELLEGADIIGPHWPTVAAYDAEEPVEQAA